MSKKTHWKKTDNPNYLGAYAFEEGEEKIGTISKLNLSEKVFNPSTNSEEDCTVAHFKQSDIKPLILNTTNKKTIAEVADSPYIEDWEGVSIQLFVTKVKAFGETVDAVRVRTKPPKVNKPKLTKSHKKYKGIVKKLNSGELELKTVKEHFDIPANLEKHLTEKVINDE